MKTQTLNSNEKMKEQRVKSNSFSKLLKCAFGKNSLYTKIFIMVLITLFCSFVALNQKGQIKGTVISETKQNPIAKADVTIFLKDTEVWTGKTLSNGTFSASLSDGVYTVKVTAENHLPYINKNVTVSNANIVTLKVVLISYKEVEEITVLKDAEPNVEYNYKPVKSRSNKNEQAVPCVSYPVGGAYTTSYDDISYIEHNTESYDVINENIFKDAVNNPLSTFSVDVDRASYANVRRYLTQNQKPPKDAVRIEELINYFDYDYPQPKNGHPFSVTIEHSKCPWNEKNQLVLIGLKGENINENEIPASNLVFLIDVSGSMNSANKLPLLKQSLKYLVNNLRDKDKVAIVVYAGAAGLVLESTKGTQKAKINAAIDNLQAGGSTAGGAGIKLAYKVAKENFIANGNNRVILATDGDFNVGASSDAEMVRLIEEKRDDGVFLTILGFGMGNYKDSKMESLSNAGNGNYAYIDNILEAKKMFGTELWGTLYTIAKDVKIQVEFNPAYVKAYRLVGYENRMLNKEDFNNDKKDAGDIGCGHTVTALYEIVPASSDEKVSNVDPLEYQKTKVLDSKNAMTVKLRYKKPNEDTSILITEKYKFGSYSNSNNIVFASAVAQFGMLLRDSEFKGSASWANVVKQAKASKGLDEHGYRNDFIKLIEMAEMIAVK